MTAVRHLTVTIPANLALADFSHHIIHFARIDHRRIEAGMAADAVVHDHLTALFASTRRLAFRASYPHGNVLHAIHALEGILASYVLMGYMAVIAGGIARMARMEP